MEGCMSTITEDLRGIAMNHGWPVCAEAATEIEELEEAYALLFAEHGKLRALNAELLEALLGLVGDWPASEGFSLGQRVRLAKAAIAKATNPTNQS
jgi:hypothetical protein